jgi:hypothetical protein
MATSSKRKSDDNDKREDREPKRKADDLSVECMLYVFLKYIYILVIHILFILPL